MALCGNGVVEEGEECDCGWEDDCSEDCCWPQRTEYPSTEKPCTLKPKRDCSPSQGPCCTNSCTFNSGEKCLDDNGCREESFCDGTSSSCPLSQVKPNKTVCNKEFVCYKGECTGNYTHLNLVPAAIIQNINIVPAAIIQIINIVPAAIIQNIK